MYYLFMLQKKELEAYKNEFYQVKSSIDKGRTPVFNELRCAKTNLVESVPYNILQGGLLIVGIKMLRGTCLNKNSEKSIGA